jgi:hypothetical protein
VKAQRNKQAWSRRYRDTRLAQIPDERLAGAKKKRCQYVGLVIEQIHPAGFLCAKPSLRSLYCLILPSQNRETRQLRNIGTWRLSPDSN